MDNGGRWFLNKGSMDLKQGCVGNEAAVKPVLCCPGPFKTKEWIPPPAKSAGPWAYSTDLRNHFTWGHIPPRTSMWAHLQGLPRFWAPHGISWSLCYDGSTAQLFVPHRIIYLFLPQMLTLSLLHNNLPPHHLGLFPRESDLQERDKQGRETVSQDSN